MTDKTARTIAEAVMVISAELRKPGERPMSVREIDRMKADEHLNERCDGE